MRMVDVCAGIGGFSLAATWAGYEVAGQVEIDPWCRRVLAKHWPDALRMNDVFEVRGDEFGPIDLLTAGIPCQPYSVAGKRLGSGDDRALWPAVRSIIEVAKPPRVCIENVAGFIGMALDGVSADLETIGYEVQSFVIPAAAVGAPHRRDRVWILADSTGTGAGDQSRAAGGQAWQQTHAYESAALPPGDGPERAGQLDAVRGLLADAGCRDGDGWPGDAGRDDANGHDTGRQEGSGGADKCRADVADAACIGERTTDDQTGTVAPERDAWLESASGGIDNSTRKAVGGLGESVDGLPGWLVGPDRLNPWAGDWEGDISRTTTHEQDRTHKLKALGNAIVPQVAYEILRAWVTA